MPGTRSDLRLTVRDHDLLETLAIRVRLLESQQIGRTWWGGAASPERAARARLRRLQAAELLVGERLSIHPMLELKRPLLSWSVGDEQPHFDRLAYACQSRWAEAPSPVWLFYASTKTARRYGGRGGSLKKRFQRTHDIHLSEVYLQLREKRPEDAAQWISEDDHRMVRGPGEKTPDALLCAADGTPRRVIDFAGAYSAKRLRAFHEDCAARRLPYELW